MPALEDFTVDVKLPAELFARIIDYLHDDRLSLRACSLVHSVWRPESQLHLFHTVVIPHVAPKRRPARWPKLLVLLGNCPHLRPHIRHLQVFAPCGQSNPGDFRRLYSSLFPRVRRLTYGASLLAGVLLSCLPALQDLELKDVGTTLGMPVMPVDLALQKLVFSHCDSEKVQSILLEHVPTTAICSLRTLGVVLPTLDEDTSRLAKFLDHVSNSLEELRVDMRHVRVEEIDSRLATGVFNVTRLALEVFPDDDTIAMLFGFLNDNLFPRLRHLEVTIGGIDLAHLEDESTGVVEFDPFKGAEYLLAARARWGLERSATDQLESVVLRLPQIQTLWQASRFIDLFGVGGRREVLLILPDTRELRDEMRS